MNPPPSRRHVLHHAAGRQFVSPWAIAASDWPDQAMNTVVPRRAGGGVAAFAVLTKPFGRQCVIDTLYGGAFGTFVRRATRRGAERVRGSDARLE